MLRYIGARVELPFNSRLHQRPRIFRQGVDRIDAHVQVVLDLVEVTVVVIRDLLGYVTLADPVDVLCGDVQRTYHRVERIVDTLDDLLEVTVMPGGVGAGVELALNSGLHQRPHIFRQGVKRVDALVEVVLDLVEVAFVVVGDLLGDVALADPVDVLGGDVQRADHGIEDLIDTLQH